VPVPVVMKLPAALTLVTVLPLPFRKSIISPLPAFWMAATAPVALANCWFTLRTFELSAQVPAVTIQFELTLAAAPVMVRAVVAAWFSEKPPTPQLSEPLNVSLIAVLAAPALLLENSPEMGTPKRLVWPAPGVIVQLLFVPISKSTTVLPGALGTVTAGVVELPLAAVKPEKGVVWSTFVHEVADHAELPVPPLDVPIKVTVFTPLGGLTKPYMKPLSLPAAFEKVPICVIGVDPSLTEVILALVASTRK